MAVRPEDLLALADELVALADDLPDIPRRDAICRAAVSRGYYAAYHHALGRAKRMGFAGSLPGFGSHEALWDGWYARDERRLGLASEANELKAHRVGADYRLHVAFLPAIARQIVADARSLIREVDAPEPPAGYNSGV